MGYIRQDRSLSQLMEVTAVNGNTITFATPFHCTFYVKYAAQLTRLTWMLTGIGVEDLYVYGGHGGHGNISMQGCMCSWIKHVEAHWFDGYAIGLIPNPIDQNPWAHWRSPMDMMRQG